MSTIFSEFVADVLLARCAEASQSQKFLLGSLLGVPTADLYAAVAGRANDAVVMTGDGENQVELSAIRLPNQVVVIPYLVTSSLASGDNNRGNRGFNGKLRDFFDRDGETRVLVTFDDDPIETQLSAMDSTLADTSLSPSALLQALRDEIHDSATHVVRPLLEHVIRFIVGLPDLSAQQITRSIHFIRTTAVMPTLEDAGNALVELPWLLRDPDITPAAAEGRLKRAWTVHRSRLEEAARAPDLDYEELVRARYEDALAERLIGARRLGEVQWLTFTYAELEAGLRAPARGDRPTRNSFDVALPCEVAGAVAQVFKQIERTPQRIGAAALVRTDDVVIRVSLARPLEGNETVHLVTFTEESAAFIGSVQDQVGRADAIGEKNIELRLNVTHLNGHWGGCQIVLTNTTTYRTRYLARIDLALLVHPDLPALPFESRCQFDPETQRFVVPDEPLVQTIHADGTLGEVPDADIAAQVGTVRDTEDLSFTIDGAPAELHVVYELPEDEPPEEHGAAELSPEHAMLRFAALEGKKLAKLVRPPFAFVHGRAQVSIGGRDFQLSEIAELEHSRWRVEAGVLSRPEWTSYTLSADGTVEPNMRLEGLSMDSLEPSFSDFMSARRAFFEAVRASVRNPTVATILAVDLAALDEAREYVAAYARVLSAVEDGTPFRAEYERILLCDSIKVAGRNDLLIAPTSPVSVAVHLQLQDDIADWREASVASLTANDPDLVTPRFVVPLLNIAERWHESVLTGYPWRLYTPLTSSADVAPEPFLPRFIARRIEAFLDVHPVYSDHRRTLTLAFVNPGSGQHVKDALLQLVSESASEKGHRLDDLPQFEIKLFTSEQDASETAIERLGAQLDRFMNVTQESGAPSWTEQELMRRLTYTKAHIDEWVGDGAAFAHIAFIQDYFRPSQPQIYDLGSLATTAYVDAMSTDLERSSRVEANEVFFSSGVWLGQHRAASLLQNITGRSLEIAAAASGAEIASDRAFGIVTRVRKDTIPLLYRRAVWVVHLDRHIGLELFYPQQDTDDPPPYILDHTDQENLAASGFDAITATAMVSPYLVRIASIFSRVVATIDDRQAASVLRWLNLISGRWALQLLRETPTQVRERLGSVVAFRLLARREDIFQPEHALSLVVSLDELLRVTGKEGLATSEGWADAFALTGKASDDLLLVHVPLDFHERPSVHARVIEVKYSEGVAPVNTAWEQINATQKLLVRMFATGGPGHAFRARVLAKLIKSYVSRLAAYGLLDRDILRDERVVKVLDYVAAGDFAFHASFKRDGRELIGDFVSVEPNYLDPLHQPGPFDGEEAGRSIGRIKIGKPLIEALIADSALEALAGDYAPPVYEVGPETTPPDGDEGGGPPPAEQPPEEPPPTPSEPGVAGEEAPYEGDELPGEEEPGPTEPVSEDGTTTAGESEPEGAAQTEQVAEDEESAERASEAVESQAFTARFALEESVVRSIADDLDQVFGNFSLPVQPFNASLAVSGPNVVRFRTRMLEGGTIAALEARGRDIQRELGATGPVYIGQEPPYVVVDVPRRERAIITFGEVLPALEAHTSQPGELPIVMGADAGGRLKISDLTEMPHLLVAGSTGSGKSVFLTAIGACLGFLPPSRIELVLIDIKGLDFAAFAQLPHLRTGGVIEDPAEAVEILEHLMTEEVARRRQIFRASGARQILEHYDRVPEADWPEQIVVMIDEYAQLVSASGRSRADLERLVQQYAQFARAFGIYLVLATQRPSIDVITGRIKANLPARCVFRVPSFNDSRTVIDTGGAEKLLGAGDMLFYRDGALERLQAPLTTDEDLARVAERHSS
jgi:hypothetical protein